MVNHEWASFHAGWKQQVQLRNAIFREQRQLELTADVGNAVQDLAWIQQRATEAQLSAQYGLMRLQAESLHAQRESNQLLANANLMLGGIAETLRRSQDAQEESLQIVKAERALKEVLFQLSTMLEEMIQPDDQIAKLALCQVVLARLDECGLDTSHLSDLEDKRAFASFVKSTKQFLRDAPEQAHKRLRSFETWHKTYYDAMHTGFPAFTARPSPSWTPTTPPVWREREKPKPRLKKPNDKPDPPTKPDCCREEVVVALKECGPNRDAVLQAFKNVFGDSVYQIEKYNATLDECPTEIVPRLANSASSLFEAITEAGAVASIRTEWAMPKWTEFLPMPKTTKARGPNGQLPYDIYDVDPPLNPDNGEPITLDNVPTAMGTERRFPLKQSGVFSAIDGWMLREEYENARKYEQALRTWAEATKYQERYAQLIAWWEEDVKSVGQENERIEKEFREKILPAWRDAEEQRKKEYERACRDHEESEKQRRAEWEETVRNHREAEAARKNAWSQEKQEFFDLFCEQGKLVNGFLDDHPDLQQIYKKIDVEKDSRDMKARLDKLDSSQAESSPRQAHQQEARTKHNAGKQGQSSKKQPAPHTQKARTNQKSAGKQSKASKKRPPQTNKPKKK